MIHEELGMCFVDGLQQKSSRVGNDNAFSFGLLVLWSYGGLEVVLG